MKRIPKLGSAMMVGLGIFCFGGQGLFAEMVTLGGEVYHLHGYQEHYESGAVKMGYLESNKTVSIGGRPYTFARHRIEFYESGKVKSGFLTSNKTVSLGGQKYTLIGDGRHHITYFSESGRVVGGGLAKEKTVKVGGLDYTLMGERHIGFYDSGKVRAGWLARKKTVKIGGRDTTFKASLITFYESGKVKEGVVGPKHILVGQDKPFVRSVGFSEDGKIIQFALLNEGGTIQGKFYKKYTVIRLYTDGSFAAASRASKHAWDDDWTGEKPKPKKPSPK